MKKAATSCMAVLLALGSAVWAGAIPLASISPDQELIVLLDYGAGHPEPEQIVSAAARGNALPADLGVGDPIRVRYLIPDRKNSLLRALIHADPDGADSRLLRYVVLSYPAGTRLSAVERALRRNPHVLNVERNLEVFSSATTPSDPLFVSGNGSGYYQWGSTSLKLNDAWDWAKGHAYVGVVDQGIDTTHPEFQVFIPAGSSWVFKGGNFRSQFSWDYGFNDNSVDEGEGGYVLGQYAVPGKAGHGTHVAGIIAAAANNAQGVAGACWNCSLLVEKGSSLGRQDNVWVPRSDVTLQISAIYGAVDRGAQVINMSFGLHDSQPNCNTNPNDAFCSVIQYATDRDVVLVAAAGNDGNWPDYPSDDPRVIGVGGIDTNGNLWNTCGPGHTFECGSDTDPNQLMAPAFEVVSTFYRGLPYNASIGCDQSLMTPGWGGYGPCTGTSMSTPYISASAGILRSVNPLLTKENIRSVFLANLNNPPGWNVNYGKGKPDVGASVRSALGKVSNAVLPNRLTPLFSFYRPVGQDYAYTTAPQMVMAMYYGGSGYSPVGPTVGAYPHFPSTSCRTGTCQEPAPTAQVFIFTGERAPYTGAPALLPLYRMSVKGPHGGNPSTSHIDTTYATKTSDLVAFKSGGYELDGIEGYVYQTSVTGAVGLHRLYNSTRDDYAIVPDSQVSAMQAAGYTAPAGLDEVIGYVYPNVDTDGDGLIDGWENLIGTSPTNPDSDCDGLSDGRELLTWPYTDPKVGSC